MLLQERGLAAGNRVGVGVGVGICPGVGRKGVLSYLEVHDLVTYDDVSAAGRVGRRHAAAAGGSLEGGPLHPLPRHPLPLAVTAAALTIAVTGAPIAGSSFLIQADAGNAAGHLFHFGERGRGFEGIEQ